MERKLAFLMHIDWKWIKQRPHFLAEKLSHFYKLDLYYTHNLRVRGLVDNQPDKKINDLTSFKKIPFSSRFPALQKLEKIYNFRGVRKINSDKYHIVWITSPIILQFIDMDRLQGAKIIYDCMDDVLAFPQSQHSKSNLFQLEQVLLKRTDILFVSSKQLQKVMSERGYNKQIKIINNAFEYNPLDSVGRIQVSPTNQYFNIVYFGTISKWFDFDLIFNLLSMFANIKFTIIGPSEIPIPKHERITFTGSVKHEDLRCYAAEANAFIMPFIINDLILSVDPVKVYEYLSYLKPTFVVKYQETLKFASYAYLYENVDDLRRKLADVMKCPGCFKPDSNKTRAFLQSNTWNVRGEQIVQILENART